MDRKSNLHNNKYEFRRRYLSDSILLIVPTHSIFDDKICNLIFKEFSIYDRKKDLEYQLYNLFQKEISTKNKESKK